MYINEIKQNVLKKVYLSEICSALDLFLLLLIFFLKVMSAYVLYKIDFQNNIWVVQTFRFKLVDYFHKQFWVKRLKPILFTVFHNLTKAIQDRIQNVLKNKELYNSIQRITRIYVKFVCISCFGQLVV